MENSIALVKGGMQHLEKRYAEWKAGSKIGQVDFQPFFDALSDDAVIYIPVTTEPRHEGDSTRQPFDVVGRPHEGKQAVINAFSADQSDLSDWVVGAPLEYFSNADGSKVVVLLKERYARPSGDVPWNHAAMVFDVSDGQIVRYTHLADMSGNFRITGYLTVADQE